MGSADARHSVPDFPSPGTWSQHSGANFPPFADELRSLPHPTLFLNVRLRDPCPAINDRRAAPPWWGSVTALPVSP